MIFIWSPSAWTEIVSIFFIFCVPGVWVDIVLLIFIKKITWYRIIFYLRRLFESCQKQINSWIWNQNQYWWQCVLYVVFWQVCRINYHHSMVLVVWIWSWTFTWIIKQDVSVIDFKWRQFFSFFVFVYCCWFWKGVNFWIFLNVSDVIFNLAVTVIWFIWVDFC